MNHSNTFRRIQELLKEKEKYTKSLKNLELLKEKREITLRQYDELKADYTRKLEEIEEALNSLKKELKDELSKLRREKEQLDEQIRKTEIRALIGEISEEKAKNQITRLNRKIDSVYKKLHLYEAAVISNSYSEFQARLERKIYKKNEKQLKRLKSFKQLLLEKEKQDNSLKNLEDLYKGGEVNKKEYENLKREYLFKLEEIIDQIESIRREIELYIAEIKVEKEHLENGIEEIEVRIKVGEIDEKEGKTLIENYIKRIKTLDQHIFKLIKIMRTNSPSQLEKIIEEEKEKEEEKKLEPQYPPRKKRFKVGYATFTILLILLFGYLMKERILFTNSSKTSNIQAIPYKDYPMYLYHPEHVTDSVHLSPYEYKIKTVKSLKSRLMLPIGLDDKLLLVDEKGNIYSSSKQLDSIIIVDSINSIVDCDPLYIGPYIIIGDLDGNLFVFNSQNLKLRARLKVDGAITAQPISVNGIVYIFTELGNLYSYDIEKDSVLWNVKLENGGRSTPAIYEKSIYLIDFNGTLYKFNRERGTLELKLNLNEPCEAPLTVYKGKLFIGTLKGTLYAITLDSLKIFYKINVNSPIKTAPTADKGAVIVGDFGGNCYAYSTLDTTLLWMYNTQAPNILGTAISDSVVIVANTEKLIALNLYTTGKVADKLWERTIQSGVISKPPFIYDGNIYLVTVDGKIVLIAPQKEPF